MDVVAVDPNKSDLKQLVAALKKHYPGSRVVMFTEPLPAMEYLENNPIDVLFTEIPMLPRDGFALQKTAEAVQPAILTVFVTDTEVYAAQAMKTHAAGYIVKPVTKAALYEALADTKFKYQ